MPQLMPMNWLFSIFVFFSVIIMMVLIYEKNFSKMFKMNILENSNYSNFWKW